MAPATAPKLARLENKCLVKHAPPRAYSQNEGSHVVYIKSSTPYISALKRIERSLDGFRPLPNRNGSPVAKSGSNIKYIVVKGMGKAIPKVVNLGIHFKYDKQLHVELYTKTIGVLDEFVPKDNENDDDDEEEEDDDVLRKRNVGSVELHIML
ncbi:DEKNAAC105649 [Brettanomyces naardenensis]|uniref:DEKNAAC105649 n=1 Tax=Brettanomyces naardenensis TaxID=13370 RepID=A0A448YTU2_BRENA|nr:DEKNAAC105649 [Brettanomyces naardenensis]